MSRISIIVVACLILSLLIIGFAMVRLSTEDERRIAAVPQLNELAECSAYYQISADTIKRMQIERMLPVADRLVAQEQFLRNQLLQAIGPDNTQSMLARKQQDLLASLQSPDQLGPLMARYRAPCQQLVLRQPYTIQ